MDGRVVRLTVMGSEAEVTVLGGGPDLAERAARRLVDLERRWSRFLPDSEISELGRSLGQPLIVSPETFQVVAAAVEAWLWSDGRFDPTTATTMTAAGYDRSRSTDPDVEILPARHVPCATPATIVLDASVQSIAVPDGVAIDLGGIGKGAAADLVAAELLDWGAAGCSVNVGGDLRVTGEPPRPEGWRIDVDLDIETGGSKRPVVGVIDGAVCTSTRALRTWSTPSGPEHHLRNPVDGSPLQTGLAAVSVIGARAVQAEVLAKVAFAAGADDAPGLIESTGATGLLVTDDGDLIALDGLAPFLDAGGAGALAA